MGENKIRIVYTYPNQKVVTTHKAESNKENIYGILNIEALHQASKVMNDKEFRLYVYMSCQQDGYTYGLSPKAIKESIGLSEDRCRSAVKGLIDKGYLVQQTDDSNVYNFCEKPEVASISFDKGGISPHDEAPISHNQACNIPKSRREILQDNTTNTNYSTFNSTDNTEKSISDITTSTKTWSGLDFEEIEKHLDQITKCKRSNQKNSTFYM